MAKGQFFLYFATAGVLSFTAVFALFAIIRPECYPKKVMRMSSTDMRLASPLSSFWCEAMELSSDHPFLAFRLSKEPRISPLSLSRNEVYLKLKLKPFETHRVQYFLLPATVVTAIMCSTHPGASIYILRGNDIRNYEVPTTSVYDESDETSDDHDDYSEELDDTSDERLKPSTWSRALKFQEIPVRNIEDKDCEISPSNKLFQVNITSADTYYVLVHHKGPTVKNFVKIRLFLDRTSYDIESGVKSVHVCSGGMFSSTCTVHLNFLSKDRVLIKIPGEPDAGFNSFRVRSSCKPRFTLITIISLIVPFSVLSFLALFAIYIRRAMVKRHFSRCNGGRLSTLSSPLLDLGACDDIRDLEQSFTFVAKKTEECKIKEVRVSTENPGVACVHDHQAIREIPDDPPPSYQSVKLNPADNAK